MIYEYSGGEQPPAPVDPDMLAAAHARLAEIPPIDTGAYRKGFFNGLLFRGSQVSTEMHGLVKNLLVADPRIRQVFTAGDQTCYYWSPQANSPEERFYDHVRDQIIPQAVDELYVQHGEREFQLRQAAWVVSRLVGIHLAPGGSGRPAQPWESVKLFMKAHERITSRLAPGGGALLLRAAPPG